MVIIEGDYKDYDSFKKDYLEDKLSRKQIMEKYGMSLPNFACFQKKVTKETGFARTRPFGKEYYVYTTKNGTFELRKRDGDRRTHYIRRFKSMDELDEAVEWLQNHDWDILQYKKVFKKKPKYYIKIKQGYHITKSIQGKSKHFCRAKDKNTAEEIVEWLQNHEWDKKKFDKVKKDKWGI